MRTFLDSWAAKLRSWAVGENPPDARTLADLVAAAPDGRDAFVYFDNDVKVRAPFDAMSLAEKLGVSPRLSDARAPLASRESDKS